ncbi:hypothetical protein LACDD01_00005 [Lactococcus sp. DD01]|nr:hypothetical protein LACDD01_00005 [Lactococcus sp. DD01]
MPWIMEEIISLVLRHYLDSNKVFLTSGGGSIIAGLIFCLFLFWGGEQCFFGQYLASFQ